jgi:adenylate cyclase
MPEEELSTPASIGTFLLADLAGYTAMTEAHGDERAADIAGSFFEEVRELLPRYRGSEIKTIGDALLARFEQAHDAVSLAARIVGDIGARHLGLGVRAGLHTGAAVEREGDWFGAAVNVACRVCEAAHRDQVLLTAATRNAMDAVAAGQLIPLGPREFKNVREPTDLYLLEFDGGGSAVAVDPVCRMRIDPARARASRVVGVRRVWFCSEACAQSFDAHPEYYDAG